MGGCGSHRVTDVETPASEAPDAAPDAAPDDRSAHRKRAAVEWVVLIGAALIIAFVIKTFLFQASTTSTAATSSCSRRPPRRPPATSRTS